MNNTILPKHNSNQL